jgi:hypothetical protein
MWESGDRSPIVAPPLIRHRSRHGWTPRNASSGRLDSSTSSVPASCLSAAPDGASVASDTLVVENVDARTLRLSWVDFPIDNALALYIDRTATGYGFVLIQPEPSDDTDAIAFDRELILRFVDDVSASNVEAFLRGGFDTAG